jgi:bacteriocin-like protein
MNQDNRVLARMQARDLTEKEMQTVTGGTIRTATVCTVLGASFLDGDPGEC